MKEVNEKTFVSFISSFPKLSQTLVDICEPAILFFIDESGKTVAKIVFNTDEEFFITQGE